MIKQNIFFSATGILFGTTTALSVWKYGGSTTANVLQAVPPGYVICAVILIAAIQLCFSSSLGNSPLFQHLEEKLHVEPSKQFHIIIKQQTQTFLQQFYTKIHFKFTLFNLF